MFEVNLYIEISTKGLICAKGHYAYVMEYKTKKGESCTFSGKGSETGTTRQRLELMAVLTAAEHLKPSEIRIFTELGEVLRPLENGWLKKWEANGWITAKGEAVKNADLWQQLIEKMQTHLFVRGEGTNEYRLWLREELKKAQKDSENEKNSIKA